MFSAILKIKCHIKLEQDTTLNESKTLKQAKVLPLIGQNNLITGNFPVC